MRVCSRLRGAECDVQPCAVDQWISVQPKWDGGKKKEKQLKNNLFNLDSCLRLYVLDVACSVDGLSVYFADGFCSKKRICIDLSVCWLQRNMPVQLSCFSTPCKSKNPMLWSCSCTQDVFGYYANCSVKMVKKKKKWRKKDVSPESKE